MSVDLEHKIDLMQQEISALQVSSMMSTKPWYRQISNIVSVAALLFSFGTTYVSYVKAESDKIQSMRQELRGILQRLSAIPAEQIENLKKYAGDSNSLFAAGGYNAQENSILSKQAAELTTKLTPDNVSAIEYFAVASAFQYDANLSRAREYFVYSEERATDFAVESSALRSIANLDFIQAHPDEGRAGYQKALGIFAKYPSIDAFTRLNTVVLTELAWAGSEATIGQFQFANQHVGNAETALRSAPIGPATDNLKGAVAQLKTALAMGAPPTPQFQPLPQELNDLTSVSGK